MSLRINHNISALNTHRYLNKNQNELSKTLEKLSSGQKINRAADGPASLVISEQMRAQITGLNQAIDNSETAVSLVQTAEANMAEINNMLISLRQLAIHASNEGVNDNVMLAADQGEIDNILQTIDRIANQAQFGTKKLLDGSSGVKGMATGGGLEFVNATADTMNSHGVGFDVKITEVATKAHATGTAALTNEMIDAGETLTVIENGKAAKYTTNADDTAETAVQNLRSEIDRNGLNLDISLTKDGRISVKHKEFGSSASFQVSSSTAGILSETGGQIMTSTAGKDIKGTLNGESATGIGRVLTGNKGTECVDGLSVRYTGVPTFTSLDEDGSPDKAETEIPSDGISVGRVFVSQNSLRFQTGGNRGQTVGFSIRSADTEKLGRGIVNKSGFDSLAKINVMDFQSAQDSLMLIDQAIDEMTSSRGDLGAFQKNTLESNLSNLKVAHENLTASESIIRDVDMAKEMATFTKNQIMSQAATSMLAQANILPENVLQLLG